MKLPFEPKILAYSISWVNNPILSVLVPIPTVKLAELRTHRLLSQFESEVINTSTNNYDLSINANSSRAIPTDKQLLFSSKKPYNPIWTIKQKGMQGKISTDITTMKSCDILWKTAYERMTYYVETFDAFDIHKQDACLLLNPFSWTTCIITADKAGWDNFFELRCPNYNLHGKRYYSKKECTEAFGVDNIDFNDINISMTYPAIREIAEKIYDLWTYNEPVYLHTKEWHIPFINDVAYIDSSTSIKDKLYISVSTCAMISYDNQDKEESIESHINRANRLITSKHNSTMEHQYQVPTKQEIMSNDFKEGFINELFTEEIKYQKGKYISNIKGWKQFRKIVENSN